VLLECVHCFVNRNPQPSEPRFSLGALSLLSLVSFLSQSTQRPESGFSLRALSLLSQVFLSEQPVANCVEHQTKQTTNCLSIAVVFGVQVLNNLINSE